jgi:signal transduction histidine kinase
MRWARGIVRFARRQHVADAALAVLLWLVRGPISTPSPTFALVQTGFLTVACAALIWRRDRPMTVLIVAGVADLAAIVITDAPGPSLAAMCALYTVCRYKQPNWGWIAAGATLVAYTGLLTTLALVGAGRRPGEPVMALLLILLAVTVGQFVRLRHEVAQRRQAEVAESAVRAERQRIARELHDVVAHHVTTMNVLVGAARTTMARDPETAAETLATAESSGREAMAEMRQLLFALRTDDVPETDDTVAFGVDRVPALVDRATTAGLPIVLQSEGKLVDLPIPVDRAIYRLVQESLTNIRKHAGGAAATVSLRYLPTEVQVEVSNDRPGQPVDKERFSSSGYGLAGMAERVAFCGGELRTGPTDAGGFRVYASFPLEASR